MSDTKAQQEPTMEEILASIRRIISEDDAPQGVEAAPEEPREADEPELDADADDYGEPVYEPEPVREPEPVKPPVPETPPAAAASPAQDEALVSPRAASAAASAFGELSSAASAPRESRSLEDLAREMLKPMLRQWLDDNLPRIVQAAVQAEVERISRSRVG
jgi:cell pole-organizing protein PopZ